MQFNFRLNFNRNNSTGLSKSFMGIWQKLYKFLFFSCLMGAIFFGWYIWQKGLSGNSWSEARKQEFINSQDVGVIFNQKNFDKVMADVEARKKASSEINNDFRDIFKSY